MVKTKTITEIAPKQPRTRAKYNCPAEAEEMIKLLNLLPSDFLLKNLTYELEMQRQFLRENAGDPNAQPSISEALDTCLKDTPIEFQEYVKNTAREWAKPFIERSLDFEKAYIVHNMASVYSEYFTMRMSVLRFIQHVETKKNLKEDYPDQPGKWKIAPLEIQTSIIEDESGTYRITGLAALIAAHGERLGDRLRKCVIDGKIFWAKRMESETCSPVCANRLYQRRFHAKKTAK